MLRKRQEDNKPCIWKLNRLLKKKIMAMPSVHSHGGHCLFILLRHTLNRYVRHSCPNLRSCKSNFLQNIITVRLGTYLVSDISLDCSSTRNYKFFKFTHILTSWFIFESAFIYVVVILVQKVQRIYNFLKIFHSSTQL